MVNAWPVIRHPSLVAHAAVLALVVGYIGLSASDNTPEANLGLALGLLALAATGAPWSLPVLMSDRLSVGSGAFVAVAACGAMLNLVLHALALRRWRKRATSDTNGQ